MDLELLQIICSDYTRQKFDLRWWVFVVGVPLREYMDSFRQAHGRLRGFAAVERL